MKIKISGKEVNQKSLFENQDFLEGTTCVLGGLALPAIMSTPSIVNLAITSKATAILYLGTSILAPVILIVVGGVIVAKEIVDRYLDKL